jgi:hypothetical protein
MIIILLILSIFSVIHSIAVILIMLLREKTPEEQARDDAEQLEWISKHC